MSNQVDALHSRKLLSVSSDIEGVFGNPLDAFLFYKRVGLCIKSLGLEVLGWKLLMRDDTFFDYFGKNIVGIHGRIGTTPSSNPIEDLKIKVLDGLIANPDTITKMLDRLIEKFSQTYYLLLHQPSAVHEFSEEFLSQLHPAIFPVIENHIQSGALDAALGLQKGLNQQQEKNVGFVFDIAHYLKEGRDNPDACNWAQMLSCLDHVGQCIIHLPIGTATHDSIPFAEISKAQWQALGKIIRKNNSFVTLEFQQGDMWSNLVGQAHMSTKLISSTRKKIEMLQAFGVIPIEREKTIH